METEAQNPPISEAQAVSQEVTQSPAQTPEPPKQKPWPIIGLTVLVLLLLGTTGFLAYQNYQLKKQSEKTQPSSTPAPATSTPTTPVSSPTATPSVPTVDPTTEWETYTNEEYSFSVKYPADFELSESALMGDFIVDFTWLEEDIGHKPGISMRVINTVGPAWTDVRDYFEKQFFSKAVGSETSGDKGKTTITEKTKIEGLDAVKTIEETIPGAPIEAYYSINTYIYRNGRIYRLTLYATNKTTALEKEATYNSMLSTLKFL